jgi:hypothetical protein
MLVDIWFKETRLSALLIRVEEVVTISVRIIAMLLKERAAP